MGAARRRTARRPRRYPERVRGAPNPDGRIVPLASYPSRFEADVVIGLLASNDIPATADYGDGDGWAPHLALYTGARVLVFDHDLEAARRVLEAASPLADTNDN
jgi:Putative prokaryotic signal transducing protein